MSRPDRMPPHNLDAESALLGSVLLDNALVDELSPLVSHEDFFRKSHDAAWRAIVALVDVGQPADPLTLLGRLEAVGEDVGGWEAIQGWMESAPSPANAVFYAGIVRQKATSRRLIDLGNRILRDGYSDQHDAEELVRLAEVDLSRIADGTSRSELATLGDAIRDSLRRLDMRSRGDTPGVATGFGALDAMIGGLRPAQLVVLGARPGMGKTALALQLLESAAMFGGGAALFVSLEMGVGELGDRAVCAGSGMSSTAYRGDAAIGRDLFTGRVAEMAGLPILIDETPGLTPSQIAATARRARRKGPLSLVVVDYLQIVGSDDRRASEYDRVGAASLALKNLSKQVQAPVIALSQLNRQVEEREDKRPKLADLRATGQIEQDADVVMFLYRGGYYDKDGDQNAAELLVAKNRHGATGLVPLTWDGPLMRFDNPEDDVDFGPAGGRPY